jgi:rhamnulose-1-phosphate aldolase
VDVLNKAAQIYISARSMGFEPEGMSDAQMQELAETFGLANRKG